MNIKNNIRFQETEEKIQKSFLDILEHKDFNKITVQEICKKSEINRSTFYAHYIDIYDLIEKTEKGLHKNLVSLYEGSGITVNNFLSEKYIIIFLKFIYDNKNFYRICLKARTTFPIEHGFEPIWNYVIKPYCTKIGFKNDEDMMYYFVYIQAGFTMMLKRWMDNDFKESPEEFSKTILKCISNGLSL